MRQLVSTYPKLRPLDIRPYEHHGQPYILLRDPTLLSDKTLFVPQSLAMVLAFCDGTRDARAIAMAFRLQYGMTLPVTTVEELLTALDEALMLENAHAEQVRSAALSDWRAVPFRSPTLAGLSYPADSGALWQLLHDYLEAAEGEPAAVDWSHPIGLLSPHIDYPRGGTVYAQVWKRATQAAQEADLVVMFGTDHYGSEPFTLTKQNYATPYGVLPTAQPLVDALVEVLGAEAALAGELRHRGEHSLELVAVWLHHMRQAKPVEIVPILVGGFHHFIQNGATPARDPLLNQVLTTIRAHMVGKRVLVVASGDLAHVGPAFNGPPLDAVGRAHLRAADNELIVQMRVGDAEGFFAAIRKVRDRNNVCGVAPIYLTLRTLDNVSGEPAGYAICPADDQATSVVTVGGMIFR